MSGSVYGKNFTISTWGESHGPALGVVIDGCPAGIPLSEEDIQQDLNKRKPGTSAFVTPRKEADKIQILSGVFKGKTTGTPLSLVVYNTNQKSKDYSKIANYYRPGHADYTYDQKYGFRDYQGGGRSSGRETTARVAAGAVAKKILARFNINIKTYTLAIANIKIDKQNFDIAEIERNPLKMPDAKAAKDAEFYLEQLKSEGDSAGGIVECQVTGIPPGIGEPVFEKLDAVLGKALFSIGAVKAVEFGSGINANKYTGSEHNDFFQTDDSNSVRKASNNAGGISGGISDGSPIIMRATFKPTPSIKKTQHTVTKDGDNIDINIEGRHDPIIVPRAVIVIEAMTALTLVDYLFQRILSRIDLIEKALK